MNSTSSATPRAAAPGSVPTPGSAVFEPLPSPDGPSTPAVSG
eukprot:COSAG04_NODE_5606_length_1553_cov_8.896836_2_plen_41_part_01